MSRVLNLLLTHQPAEAVGRMVAWWSRTCAPEDVLVVFNGDVATFERIAHPQKLRVTDPRLQTRRHQQEKQSYTVVLQSASRWLQGRDFTHVHLAEYDHVPLVPDLAERQLARLEQERADVLGFGLVRVDGTNFPHYLFHLPGADFTDFWRGLSVRRDPAVVLNMLGSGSFWTRAAFDAVATREETLPIYLEIYLPTLAHHLGYRMRDWQEQNRFASSQGDFTGRIEEARREGAWTLHPVKTLWDAAAIGTATAV